MFEYLKVLILLKLAINMSVDFVITGTLFMIIIFCYQSLLCNGCHNVMEICIGFNYVTILLL